MASVFETYLGEIENEIREELTTVYTSKIDLFFAHLGIAHFPLGSLRPQVSYTFIEVLINDFLNVCKNQDLQALRHIFDTLYQKNPGRSSLQQAKERLVKPIPPKQQAKERLVKPIPPKVSPIDFLIITPLEEERDAILSKLPVRSPLPPHPNFIHICYSSDLPVTFSDNSTGTYHNIVMPLLNMGRAEATAATVEAIYRWHPRYIILVGIAGGNADQGVGLGDILAPREIVDYELQKWTPEGPQVRWQVYPTDRRLLGAVQSFTNDAAWQQLISTPRPDGGLPKRHHKGSVASGDKVDATGKIFAKYRSQWPQLLGIEMEAGGVALASILAAHPPGYFMIRGVSDLADPNKDSEEVKKWRQYACDVAASYTIALLQSGPVPLT